VEALFISGARKDRINNLIQTKRIKIRTGFQYVKSGKQGRISAACGNTRKIGWNWGQSYCKVDSYWRL